MEMDDSLWLEAAAEVQADLDADLRADAYEVYVAEAARSRLTDRTGPARMTLRSGHLLIGELASVGDGVDGMLTLVEPDGRPLHVPFSAIAILSGPPPQLRDEQPAGTTRTIGSRLREAWALAEPVRMLLCTGQWVAGVIDFVGADHVGVSGEGEPVVVAVGAVDAWGFGR